MEDKTDEICALLRNPDFQLTMSNRELIAKSFEDRRNFTNTMEKIIGPVARRSETLLEAMKRLDPALESEGM